MTRNSGKPYTYKLQTLLVTYTLLQPFCVLCRKVKLTWAYQSKLHKGNFIKTALCLELILGTTNENENGIVFAIPVLALAEVKLCKQQIFAFLVVLQDLSLIFSFLQLSLSSINYIFSERSNSSR